MRIKTESIEVNGVKYTTTQYPAMRAFSLLAKLTKVIGPALGALGGMDKNMDLAKAAPMLISALTHVDANELPALAIEVLGSTTALLADDAGQPQVVSLADKVGIDRAFSGALGDLFQVLGHAVKVNYADFFGGSGVPADAQPAPVVS